VDSSGTSLASGLHGQQLLLLLLLTRLSPCSPNPKPKPHAQASSRLLCMVDASMLYNSCCRVYWMCTKCRVGHSMLAVQSMLGDCLLMEATVSNYGSWRGC